MFRRSRLVALAAAAVLALALSGCVQSNRPATSAAGTKCPWKADTSVTTSARIAYQKIPNADLVVKDRGILEACMPKAKITWSSFASGGDVVQAYGAKSVDVGLMGSSPATIAMSKPLSLPVSVIWIHDVIGDAESLVARDASVKKLTDLKGKKSSRCRSVPPRTSPCSRRSRTPAWTPARKSSSSTSSPRRCRRPGRGSRSTLPGSGTPLAQLVEDGGRIVLSSADTAKAGQADL